MTRHIQDPAIVRTVYSDTTQSCSGIHRTLINICICRNLVYLETWYILHIQNPGIFRTHDIFRTLSRHILRYFECCVAFKYWKPCNIQNFAMLSILAYLGHETYSKSCLVRHIQAHSIIVTITLTFSFHFNVTYLSTKFKKTSFLTTVTSI